MIDLIQKCGVFTSKKEYQKQGVGVFIVGTKRGGQKSHRTHQKFGCFASEFACLTSCISKDRRCE